MNRRYRVGEFAELTGVSVRTLHHYDRIGLLSPAARSGAGYRLYGDDDLLCLQQILTLRYLGFSLEHIRRLLQRRDFDLVASMRIQRVALRDRIADLERVDAALGALLARRQATGRWDWTMVAGAFRSVQKGLEPRGDRQMNEYYSPEEMRKQFDEVRNRVTPEEISSIEQRWTALLRDVRSSNHLEPASPEAQELADRWDALQRDTFRGYGDNDKLMASIGEGYRQGRYAHIEGAPAPEDFAFIARVKESRSR